MTPLLISLTSLEKRLREDAERCRAEMEKYQIPHATKGRGAE